MRESLAANALKGFSIDNRVDRPGGAVVVSSGWKPREPMKNYHIRPGGAVVILMVANPKAR